VQALGQTASHPLDLLKVRLQVQGAGPGNVKAKQYTGIASGLMHVVRTEGLRGCYKGWQAAVLREFSYSGLRIGLYEPVKNLFGATDPAHTPLYLKVASGACSGMLGAAIANPFDLVKVQAVFALRLSTKFARPACCRTKAFPACPGTIPGSGGPQSLRRARKCVQGYA
jgi:hypothetical protein